MAKPNKSKSDYSLAVRVQSKDGKWSNWTCKGQGKWIGLEHVQNQIKMLRQAFNRDMEIAFFKEGKYLGYDGKEIGKPIYYEKTR